MFFTRPRAKNDLSPLRFVTALLGSFLFNIIILRVIYKSKILDINCLHNCIVRYSWIFYISSPIPHPSLLPTNKARTTGSVYKLQRFVPVQCSRKLKQFLRVYAASVYGNICVEKRSTRSAIWMTQALQMFPDLKSFKREITHVLVPSG